MTQRSKPVRYYSEDDVKNLIHRMQTSNENPVSIEYDFWNTAQPLTLRPEVAAFAQAIERDLNDRIDQPDDKPALWVQHKIASGALFLDEAASEGDRAMVLFNGAQIAANILRFADVMGGLKGE